MNTTETDNKSETKQKPVPETPGARRERLQARYNAAVQVFEDAAAKFAETGDGATLTKARAEMQEAEQDLDAHDDGEHCLGERQRAKVASQAMRARESAYQERCGNLLAGLSERTEEVGLIVKGMAMMSRGYRNFLAKHQAAQDALRDLKPELGSLRGTLSDRIPKVRVEDDLRRLAELSNLEFLEGFVSNPFQGERKPDPVGVASEQANSLKAGLPKSVKECKK